MAMVAGSVWSSSVSAHGGVSPSGTAANARSASSSRASNAARSPETISMYP